DFSPQETVAGAVQAVRSGGIEVLLVGDLDRVKAELSKHGTDALSLPVVPSEGVIEEGEPPALALRHKPKASIVVAGGLVKAGRAHAFVTMGSTGAAMAVGAVLLGTMEGLERPALGGPIVGLAPNTVILDLGSNIDCRPSQMAGFAAIGAAFARTFLGVQDPRIGLLSVGAEEGKGNRQTREAYELFKASGLPFVGNVEGHDLLTGKAEVVVCDGFTGNVLMKFAEGLGRVLAEHLKSRLSKELPGQKATEVGQEVYDLLNSVERVGGGPLFGVNGVAIVGHGRSRAPSVAQALLTAKRAVELGLVERMREDLNRLRQRVQL
ncbi:MAG: phosphate acyltransferase PlsX, partial [Chloroflexi bacterium]|nr:phosphate acyltransferase PlsX [Chloroflexota bacterium]